MNKKVLSIAAAGFIAAGLIGCGGSSSSSTSSTASTQPTQVKGVDGYVMNAKVTVNYWDKETNTTKSVAVDTSKNYYLTVDSATNKPKAGSAVYSLADLNSTVLNNVVSIDMSSQAQGKLADGSVYAATFFDADGNGELNTTIDTLITSKITLSAPKGYSVVTPISTLIAQQVTAQLKADNNETNLTNVVDAYTKDIANALGVDSSTIKNVDPLSLVKSTDEKAKAYVVANAFAGAIIADPNADKTKVFKALKAAKAPKTAADVIGNLESAAKTGGATATAKVLTQIQNLIKTNTANLDAIVKANLDKTRKTSIANGGDLAIVSLQSAGEADFNMTKIDTASGANGYKIASTDLNNLQITLAPNDANISNKTFKFVIRVADPKLYNAQDTNVSSLTVEVPFEVNATDKSVAVSIPKDAQIRYEGMNAAGTKIINGEANFSALGFSASTDLVDVSSNVITIKAKDIIAQVDSNKTKTFGGTFPQGIVEIQAGIIPESAVAVDGTNAIIMPQDNIVSVGGYINETVDSMISFDTEKTLVADMRSAVTSSGDNKAPNNDLNISGITGFVGNLAGTLNKGSDTNASLGRKIVNNNTALDINLTASTNDNWEKNTTVAWTLGSYLSDKNLSTASKALKANSAADAIATNAIDVNTSSTAEGNLTTSITYNVCDEFNDCNTTTAYLVVNRAPVFVKTVKIPDHNLSESNLTLPVLFKDHDDFGNINVEVNVTDQNTSNMVALQHGSWVDVNITGSYKVKMTISDDNSTLEINGSDSIPSDAKIQLKILDLNDTYNAVSGDEGKEFNITK